MCQKVSKFVVYGGRGGVRLDVLQTVDSVCFQVRQTGDAGERTLHRQVAFAGKGPLFE